MSEASNVGIDQLATKPNKGEKMSGRFDYVKYDEESVSVQASAKAKVEELETLIEEHVIAGRAKALALTKLEEVYMWVGKAIRDEQIARNGSAQLQEERTNI